MKKLILLISILLMMTAWTVAQEVEEPVLPADSVAVTEEEKEQPGEMEEYRVTDTDDWLKTWEKIQPKIEDYLSDKEDERIEWDETDKKYKKVRGKRGYFRGGAGGWDFVYMPMSLDAINEQIENKMGISGFDDNMLLHGGGGWAFIGKGIRIGGMGASGRMTTNGMDQTGQVGREADLQLKLGGFLIEKVFHPFSRTELYAGAVIGSGHMELSLLQESGQSSWDEVWTGYSGSDPSTFQNEMKADFFMAMPSVGFRYNILRWCGLGASVGYYYADVKGSKWNIENNRVASAPDMDMSNLFYKFNIYFGG